MSDSYHPASCPSCGTLLRGRSICPQCGALVPLESGALNFWLSLKDRMRNLGYGVSQSARRRILLWTGALVPLLVWPALFSLAYASWKTRRGEGATEEYRWISLIALANVVISFVLLYSIHGWLADHFLQLVSGLKATLFGGQTDSSHISPGVRKLDI